MDSLLNNFLVHAGAPDSHAGDAAVVSHLASANLEQKQRDPDVLAVPRPAFCARRYDAGDDSRRPKGHAQRFRSWTNTDRNLRDGKQIASDVGNGTLCPGPALAANSRTFRGPPYPPRV